MAKEKKISFKYFLNSRLKSKDGKSYPLYVQVVFNSLMTKIKPLKSLDIWMTDEEFDSWEQNIPLHPQLQQKVDLLKYNETLIEKVVRLEHDKKQKFTFKGIGNLVDLYSTKILNVLEKGLFVEVQNRLETTLSVEQYKMVMIDENLDGIIERLDIVVGKDNAKEVMASVRLRQYAVAFELFHRFVLSYADKKGEVDALHNPLVFTISEWRLGAGRQKMAQFYSDSTNWFEGMFVDNKFYFESSHLEIYISLINSELIRYFKFSSVS